MLSDCHKRRLQRPLAIGRRAGAPHRSPPQMSVPIARSRALLLCPDTPTHNAARVPPIGQLQQAAKRRTKTLHGMQHRGNSLHCRQRYAEGWQNSRAATGGAFEAVPINSSPSGRDRVSSTRPSENTAPSHVRFEPVIRSKIDSGHHSHGRTGHAQPPLRLHAGSGRAMRHTHAAELLRNERMSQFALSKIFHLGVYILCAPLCVYAPLL